MDEYFVGVREFARRFDLGRSKGYELVATGVVRSVAVGGRKLVPVTELDRFARALCDAAGIEEAPQSTPTRDDDPAVEPSRRVSPVRRAGLEESPGES